ncbi:hypothetical protein M9Y10_038788 [Tritrichomonas musculus]|uniref:Peptidase M60 domain-containing protein n=1 Tax=Tritrichomonas musculus TaxID=1915356 RepID=A0ABR2K9H0_9EUKA
MGCGSSSSKASIPVSPKHIAKPATVYSSDVTETSMFGFSPAEIEEIFYFLVSNCSTFHCPPGMVPIACLDENSIPIVISSLSFDGSTQTGIDMPILAAGVRKTGRVVCFGHVCMFNRNYFNSGDTAVLIHNTIIWLNDKKGLINPIQFISIPREYHSEIKGCFHPHGIQVQFTEFSTEIFQENKFVIIPSYFDINNSEKKRAIKDLIRNGGGIGCVYIPKEGTDFSGSIPINKFLIKFGLSFTYCSLSEDTSTPFAVNVHESFDATKKYIFYSLVDQFNRFINSGTCSSDSAYLDDLVTELRYNILVSGKDQIHLILLLIDLCWQYLKLTEYKLENGLICPDIYHVIIIILLLDLYQKQPIDCIIPSPEASTFPGLAYDVEPEDIKVSLQLQDESIISTGLWLQPGVVSCLHLHDTSCLANKSRCLFIQVGSHSLSLLAKQGPWKRWPNVVNSFKIEEKKDEKGEDNNNNANEVEIQFISRFGGIVYIAVSSFPDEFYNTDLNEKEAEKDETEKNEVPSSNPLFEGTFEKVVHYPIAVYNDKNVYLKTKDLNVPWGELVSKSIIFTLPSKYLKQIDDFDKLFGRIEEIIKILSDFMNYPIVRPYRIVFDIETVDDRPVAHYPIVMLEDDINDILFSTDKPTAGLFRCLMMLALVSVRDGCFDHLTEDALSAFVAAHVFKKLFPSFDPIEKPLFQMPVLFEELWLINLKVNNKVIPNIIAKSQNSDSPVYDVPEDRWIAFVRDLCFTIQLNFLPVLEKLRPIPLNLATTLNTLKVAPSLQG